MGECAQNIVKHYGFNEKQVWGNKYKETTKRRPGGPKVTHFGIIVASKSAKNAENNVPEKT